MIDLWEEIKFVLEERLSLLRKVIPSHEKIGEETRKEVEIICGEKIGKKDNINAEKELDLSLKGLDLGLTSLCSLQLLL